MLSKPTALLLLCLLACSSTIQISEARRSRIDLPIPLAAEAPHSDNLATASGSESAEVRVPAPASMVAVDNASSVAAVENKEESEVAAPSSVHEDEVVEDSASDAVEAAAAEPAAVDAVGSVGELEEECDPDMIGFEIVTG